MRVFFLTNRLYRGEEAGEQPSGDLERAFAGTSGEAGEFRCGWVDHVESQPDRLTVCADPLESSGDAIAGSAEMFAAMRVYSEEALRRRLVPHVLMFVHGYRTTFRNAIREMEALVRAVTPPRSLVIPLVFAWPATAKALGYFQDRGASHSAGIALGRAAVRLANYLHHRPQGVPQPRLHVLAYSMGARVLEGALEHLKEYDTPEFITTASLTAPDVESRALSMDGSLHALTRMSKLVQVYYNAADRALQVSQAHHRTPRLGLDGPAPEGRPINVISIDCEDVVYARSRRQAKLVRSTVSRWLGHHYMYCPEIIGDLKHTVRGRSREIVPGRQSMEGTNHWFALLPRVETGVHDPEMENSSQDPTKVGDTIHPNTIATRQMQGSDLLVKCLEAEGIDTIFGIPGEENADFVLSLEKSTSIRFVLTRHEQGAAFMAEIYGRLTGRPAGCLATLGPGATNLITGVADSNMDRAPMLVLTGQGSTKRLHKESHQIMDVVAMFRPVTKWATTILSPEVIPEIVRKAVRVAKSEKPGAVLIELPEDVAEAQAHPRSQPMHPIRFRRPSPNQDLISHAWGMIASAERPVILAGNGCIRTRASEQLRRFAKATNIGVLSTFMAKGCVDMDSDQSLFTIGLGAKDITTRAIDDADLVISLGFDMVEYHPNLWNPSCTKQILHADFLPAEIDQHYHPTLELVGDLAETIGGLADQAEADGKSWQIPMQKKVREAMQVEFEAHKDDSGKGPVRPQKALWDARQVMGPNDLVLSDVGAHKMWIARHYQCHEPNTCLIPNGFCSMGFALPGAIAASMLDRDQKVLAISGDAGFMMNVQEMETARRYDCDMTVMVWEDKAYGLIAWKQEAGHGHHTKLDFDNPDWAKLADAFGWSFHHVSGADDVMQQLKNAVNTKGPSLVVVPIDYNENMELTRRLGEITAQI